VTVPGESISVALDVDAHWPSPGGLVEESEGIDGRLGNTARSGGRVVAAYTEQLTPFLDPLKDGKSKDGPTFGIKGFIDAPPPRVQARPPENIKAFDYLLEEASLPADATAQDVARVEAFTSLVARVVPEPSPIVLGVVGLGCLVLGRRFLRQAPCISSATPR
jgi:hypothetical protein